tara:strand:+ start:198 stop:704 length:507 start_codon:yes stop_codon:yes gene_type:complete
MDYRIGNGIDVHPLIKGRKLILGGVHIQYKLGCDGHSDGDVLTHSIIDAILGALGKGDIGDYFPSSDQKFKGVSSIKLLDHIYNEFFKEFTIENESVWNIANIDSTIILQEPIIKPYIEEMKEQIGISCSLNDNISIKATTTDHLGFIGAGKGIAAITNCLLIKKKNG